MTSKFINRLDQHSKPLVADGAIGTIFTIAGLVLILVLITSISVRLRWSRKF